MINRTREQITLEHIQKLTEQLTSIIKNYDAHHYFKDETSRILHNTQDVASLELQNGKTNFEKFADIISFINHTRKKIENNNALANALLKLLIQELSAQQEAKFKFTRGADISHRVDASVKDLIDAAQFPTEEHQQYCVKWAVNQYKEHYTLWNGFIEDYQYPAVLNADSYNKIIVELKLKIGFTTTYQYVDKTDPKYNQYQHQFKHQSSEKLLLIETSFSFKNRLLALLKESSQVIALPEEILELAGELEKRQDNNFNSFRKLIHAVLVNEALLPDVVRFVKNARDELDIWKPRNLNKFFLEYLAAYLEEHHHCYAVGMEFSEHLIKPLLHDFINPTRELFGRQPFLEEELDYFSRDYKSQLLQLEQAKNLPLLRIPTPRNISQPLKPISPGSLNRDPAEFPRVARRKFPWKTVAFIGVGLLVGFAIGAVVVWGGGLPLLMGFPFIATLPMGLSVGGVLTISALTGGLMGAASKKLVDCKRPRGEEAIPLLSHQEIPKRSVERRESHEFAASTSLETTPHVATLDELDNNIQTEPSLRSSGFKPF